MMKFKRSLLLVIVMLMLLPVNASAMFWSSSGYVPPLVLMYHRIADDLPSDAFTITSEMFENDIKELAELGYEFCTVDELDKFVRSKKTGKIVAITFDDGYKSDVMLAVPILKKYNACATFFIIGSKIGKEGYVTESDLKIMQNSGVAQIGNHSFSVHEKSYDDVRRLTDNDPDFIVRDILLNKKILERIIGKTVTAYSFPYGIYGTIVDYKLKENGIATLCSDEKVIKTMNEPYGRFNRPYDLSIDEIIKRVELKSRQ